MAKNSILLSSFASRSEKKAQTCGITEYLPPTAVREERLTFDFAPLFIADTLIMVACSFHEISQFSEGRIPEFYEQVRILYNEGFLELADFSELSDAERQRITHFTERDIDDVDKWISAAEAAILGWENRRGLYAPAYGIERQEDTMIPFIVNDALSELGLEQTLENADLVKKAVRSKKKKFSKDETLVRKAVCRAMLDYVHSMIVIADKHSSANLEWQNYQHILLEKYGLAKVTANEAASVATTFFDVVLAYDLQSADLRKVVQCLKDKRMQSVREYFKSLEVSKVGIDESIKDDFLHALTAHEIAQKKHERFVGRGKRFLGTLRDATSFTVDSTLPGGRQMRGAAKRALDNFAQLGESREIRELKNKRELWLLLHEKLLD